jgi:hypothetical protein
MTHQPCCGLATPPTLRGSGARIGGPAVDGRYPWAHVLFPIGGIPPPCTDASYAHGQEFRHSPPLLCHSLRLPSGAWGLTPQPGFPDTPRLFVGLSAAPVGHRQPGLPFPRSPAAGEDGVDTHPRPHFRNTQPEHRSPDLSGSPNRQSPGSPLGMWIGVGRQPLSHRTPR